jgi:ParB family chromosome partitioning protein
MAKKRAKVDLTQAIRPQTGDLEKLFATEGDVEQAAGLQLLAVRVDAILPDPGQPRRTFPEDSLRDLSDSILQDGVIQPIEVAEVDPGRLMIVHGERRWRAAEMAGLETIPAVVRRRDYDTLTRFVRQMVENIQREDLNDVDRAAALLRLRDLLQAELDAEAGEEGAQTDDSPWSKTITWAKVGKRLGYSRQRIHQLIRLLDLPEEIKSDVRTGRLSERDTRIYQGLQARQQRALHRARYKDELSIAELRRIAKRLKEEPSTTVSQAIRAARRPGKVESEQVLETSFKKEPPLRAMRDEPWSEGGVLPARQTRPTNIDRLDWIRGHLARIQRHGLSAAEREETVRLLGLILQDVTSLLQALGDDEAAEDTAAEDTAADSSE